MLEAGLLKNLVHPNIVNYKESFLGEGTLIIIMEYCEGKYLVENFDSLCYRVDSW